MTTIVVALHALLVTSGFADEPRMARRRGAIVPPEEAANRAFKPIEQIQIEAQLKRSVLPVDRAARLFDRAAPAGPNAFGREVWHTSVYAWVPPEYFHRQLYFDDVPLERYGQSVHPRLQPAVSTVKYFSDVVFLPYRMVVDSPHQWVSPLGYERPGNYAEPIRERGLALPGTYPPPAVVERPILVGQ